jgi:hypothetical protein
MFRIRLEEDELRTDDQKSGTFLITKSAIEEYKNAFLDSVRSYEQKKAAGQSTEKIKPHLMLSAHRLTEEQYKQYRDEIRQLDEKWDQISRTNDTNDRSLMSIHTLLTAYTK